MLWYSQERSAAKVATYNVAYVAAYHNKVAANIECWQLPPYIMVATSLEGWQPCLFMTLVIHIQYMSFRI